MSTDLITYSSAVPDFLQEAGGYRDEGLGAGIAPKAPKLSVTTSKQWSITENGQTIILPAPTINGVIVASAQTLTKAWYEKVYTPGSNVAPDCFSNDGKTPAPGVAKPQCSNCATCPKNAFGSHPVTGRGKACGDRKMVVVALETMPDKLATFNIPTMSLGSLREIDGKLKSANIPLQSVMMQFSFDPGVVYPVAKIGAIGYIDKVNFERFRDLAESDEVSALLREVDYDPAAETASQQPVVPNNQIAFGTGGQQQIQQQAEQTPTITPAEQAVLDAKKAYEAAMAAAAGGTNAGNVQQASTTGTAVLQQAQNTNDVLSGAGASGQTTTAGQTPASTGRKRRTRAEMEAARAQAAQQQQQPAQQETLQVNQQADMLTQGVASALQQTQAQQVEQPVVQQTQSTGGQPDVLALLSKWQTK